MRSARKYGSILVRDRNVPVATLIPATEEPAVNVFERWKPLRKFAAALDRPVGGTLVASVVVMRYDEDGDVLDVGRKTRTISPAIRRALTARDTRCQFPGCTARRCDAHHVVHWAEGGVTALDNLVLLCRRHHRLLHEGGYTAGRDVEGALRFVRPNGYPLECVPALPRWTASTAPLGPTGDRLAAAGIEIGPHTAPLWDGTPFNVGVVIDALRGYEPLDRPGPH